MRSLGALTVTAVALAACGSAGSTTAQEPTSLTVSFRSGAGTAPVVQTLRCAPAGGTVFRPGRACLRLAAMSNRFAPTPKDALCTEIYGGPETARVTGTYRGARVDTTFSRRNGCEIARWNRHAFLLGSASS